MWREIWGLVKNQQDLLDEAYKDSTNMLLTTKDMFTKVVKAYRAEINEDILSELRKVDIKLNKAQRSVRKKVVEHLAMSRGEGLLTGLILISIVIDIERIGDYTKNMAELTGMVPREIKDSEYISLIENLVTRTEKMFDDTLKAFRDDDKQAAGEVAVNYGEVSSICNNELQRCFKSTENLDTVPKSMMALVLILRFIKRVSAHLHNIASATGGPFHRIGYKFQN